MKRLFLMILLCVSSPTWAWGKTGHAAVASLAEARLTPTAYAAVAALLKEDLNREDQPSGRTTLAAVASWADEIREIAPNGTYAGWHVRNNPICSDQLGTCKNGHCIDQNIIRYAAILKDRSKPLRERNEALKFVVHFVGDLHMPLHSGSNSDASGGKIRVRLANGKTKSLHEYWDGDAANLALKMGALTGDENLTVLAPDSPTQWMREVRELSRHAVYGTMPEFSCGMPSPAILDISASYQQQATETARKQLWIAGIRLAQLLNAVFAD